MGVRTLPAKHNPFKAPGVTNRAGFTIGTEGSDIINVAVQLKDSDGKAITAKSKIFAWLSDTAGAAPITTAPGTVAIGTNGVILVEETTKKVWTILTDSSGRFDFNITKTGAATMYLNVAMPDGTIATSSVITFAA